MQKTWGHAKLNQGCSQQNSDCKKLYRMKDSFFNEEEGARREGW